MRDKLKKLVKNVPRERLESLIVEMIVDLVEFEYISIDKEGKPYWDNTGDRLFDDDIEKLEHQPQQKEDMKLHEMTEIKVKPFFRKMRVESGFMYDFWNYEKGDYDGNWTFVPVIDQPQQKEVCHICGSSDYYITDDGYKACKRHRVYLGQNQPQQKELPSIMNLEMWILGKAFLTPYQRALAVSEFHNLLDYAKNQPQQKEDEQ